MCSDLCGETYSVQERGERVFLLLLDTPEFAGCYLGAIKIGVVSLPLKQADYEYLLNDSQARRRYSTSRVFSVVKLFFACGLGNGVYFPAQPPSSSEKFQPGLHRAFDLNELAAERGRPLHDHAYGRFGAQQVIFLVAWLRGNENS